MSKTSVTFLLDRSGSMNRIKNDTIGGFNGFLQGLQEGDAAANTELTLIQFDTFIGLGKIYVNKPVKGTPKLTGADYTPETGGWTPLIDAAYKTIKAVEKAVDGIETKVVIAIQTDGEENSSHEYTWRQLNDLIKEKTELGWQFNFLGVGIDAYKQAEKMGIATAATASASMDAKEMAVAYASLGQNTAKYAAGAALNTSFSSMDKKALGDIYDPDLNKAASAPKPIVSSKTYYSAPAAAPKRKPIVGDIDLTK